MNIEIITEFFYKRAADRVKNEVERSGLTHNKIYKPDYKQISRIINNKRGKKNPFLICDAVIANFYEDDTGKYVPCGLLNTLNFNNDTTHLLWGNNEEIASYLFDLFELLWTEVSDKDSPYGIDRELFLYDYIPYAKYSSYWDILFSPQNKYPAIAYGIFEDDVIENIDSSRDNALKYLYKRCKNDFYDIFTNFTKETQSFHKIDKVLKESFIEKSFIPLLRNYMPGNSSLGLRVRNLILSDLSHCATIVFHESNEDINYHSSLINASNQYILALEKLQLSEIR